MEEPEAHAKMEAQWQRDSELNRLAHAKPAVLFSEVQIKKWKDENLEKGFQSYRYPFSVRSLKEDKFIGYFTLWVDFVHADAMVGISMCDRDFWGKGYGTDAMKLCLQYAFTELNLFRVTLGLLEYNVRALRSYEKAGFRMEGRSRGDVMFNGSHYDSLWMGILREEWIKVQNGEDK